MNPILFLSILFLLNTTLTSQDKVKHVNNKGDKVEEKIWSLEEDYISYFKEANHREILSLWHPKILAWPDSEQQPTGREGGAFFLEDKYPTPSHVIFKIDKKGIKIIENVVITHYLLMASWIDEGGSEQKSESRITHTWIKENSKWKILGGMSCKK
jgi:ketosteroid isomerase-like protein